MAASLPSQQDAPAREARCECGQLIAKLQAEGLELKCKRCKRLVRIPFAEIEGWTRIFPSPTP